MRILLATDHYPPDIGGAQIQSQVLASGLRERGHEVVVATVWQNGMASVQDDGGTPVHRVRQLRSLPRVARPGRNHQPPFPDPVTVVALRQLIKRFAPDVVHSYGWISYSCAVALMGSDVPLVLTARDYAYACANRTLMRDGYDCSGPGLVKCIGCAGRHYGRPKGWIAAVGVLASRPLLRRKAAVVHSISGYVQEMTRRDFIDDARSNRPEQVVNDVLRQIDLNADDQLSRDVAQALELLPSDPFILFVGALRRVKGVQQLLTAYQSLTAPPPLVLVGTIEPDTPDIPDGVVVLTDFPHDAVLRAWDRSLFGVMPSLWPEPFGTVVFEAMSRGKPVIGTAPGGHADMILNGETGFLVPRGDVGSLAHAMHELIDDDMLRERLGQAARVRARQFTADVSVPRIEWLYDFVSQQRPADDPE
jgi:glycosyltransferase involved in cell wall biosynthesis